MIRWVRDRGWEKASDWGESETVLAEGDVGEVFELLLNPGMAVKGGDGGRMPVLKGMRRARRRTNGWL